MNGLPSPEKILGNLKHCSSLEQRYIYLIELGRKIMTDQDIQKDANLVPGCQSKAWMKIGKDLNGKLNIYADSESSIVKGILAVIISFYQGLDPKEVIEKSKDIKNYFDELGLTKYLTPSRVQGASYIVKYILEYAHHAL